LDKVVRQPDTLTESSGDKEWLRAPAKAAPYGNLRLMLDMPMTDSLKGLRTFHGSGAS